MKLLYGLSILNLIDHDWKILFITIIQFAINAFSFRETEYSKEHTSQYDGKNNNFEIIY